MPNSIIATAYDLLSFHGSGNDGLFERCFEKVCSFYNAPLNDTDKKKHRRWAYHFLRSVGYIELVRSTRQWCTVPPVLVEIGDCEFALLGATIDTERLQQVAPKNALSECVPKYTTNLFPVSFFPTLPLLKATKVEVRRLAEKNEFKATFDYQNNLFQFFPSIDTVLSKVLVPVTDFPIFQPNSGRKFDFNTNEWEVHPVLQPYSPGLYRSDLEFAAPKYFFALPGKDQLEIFILRDREWALICLLAKFGRKLRLQYNRKASTLMIQSSGYAELRLPTLLERCLRSGTLTAPDMMTSGWTSYHNIRYANIWHLLAKLPIFSVDIS